MSDSDPYISEALKLILNKLGSDGIEIIASTGTAEEFKAKYHFSIGMSLRNALGLWKPHTESALVKWFWDNLKLTHADDMSGIIMDALWHQVHCVPYGLDDMKEAAKIYIEHWYKTLIE